MTAGAGQGWYSDPTGRHQLRWWTGTAWAAAVGDDGVQSFDADGLVADRPLWPRAEPTADDHAEVLATCAAGSLPGDDPLSAAVLVIWRRRNAMVDLFPTWSVHDGAGTWLGTVVLEVAGPTPNDRRFVMHRPDATSVVVVADLPRAIARVWDVAAPIAGSGVDSTTWAERASIVADGHGVQRLAAVVDGMTVAHATYSVGEVAVADAVGNHVARLVPPPLKVRRAVGRRVGWDPALVAEQVAVGDPVTARGCNALALAWEHVIREHVG